MEVAIDATDDNIAIRNSTNSNELLINSDGSINVNTSGGGSSTVKIEDTNGDPITTDSGSLNVKLTNSPSVSVSNFKLQPISGSVSVSNFPATQVVSGTVTSNIGTTNGLALDSTVSGLLTDAQLRTSL